MRMLVLIFGNTALEFWDPGSKVSSGITPGLKPPPIPWRIFFSDSSSSLKEEILVRLRSLEGFAHIKRLTPAPRSSVSRNNSGKPGI